MAKNKGLPPGVKKEDLKKMSPRKAMSHNNGKLVKTNVRGK